MKKTAYYLFELFSRMLCALPKRGMYLFADFLYLLAYYVIGYRKKVVYQNLLNAFPEKSPKEIKAIAKKFYKHLADIMIENIAILNMSKKKVSKFVQISDLELLEKLHRKNINTIALTGHYGNWEILPTMSPYISYTILSVYKPLKSKFFDKKVYQMRRRFEGIPVPMKSIYKEIFKREREGDSFVTGLVSDQSPPRKNINYWTTFMNQETSFFTGGEKMAKKFNHAVVFILVKKVKRGMYSIYIELLSEEPRKTKEHEITERYIRALENSIREQPEHWLWSHRRWKYKKDDVKQAVT